MIRKDEYIRKMQAKFEEWNAEIDTLATKVGADVKSEYLEQIELLKAKQASARQKIEQLQHAGEGAWEDMKSGIELAWTAMGEAIDSARSHYNSAEFSHPGREPAMSYYFSKIIHMKFDKAVSQVTEELKNEGFGILTEIDVTETLKRKLNVVFPNYTILGACNPPFAYKALQAEPHIGLMLPCNVIIRELADGKTEIAAVDPIASMQSIQNPELQSIALEIQGKLKKVIARL